MVAPNVDARQRNIRGEIMDGVGEQKMGFALLVGLLALHFGLTMFFLLYFYA